MATHPLYLHIILNDAGTSFEARNRLTNLAFQARLGTGLSLQSTLPIGVTVPPGIPPAGPSYMQGNLSLQLPGWSKWVPPVVDAIGDFFGGQFRERQGPVPFPTNVPGPTGPVPSQLPSQNGQPAGCCPSGYHWNKSTYWTQMQGVIQKGTRCVKNRRMNPLNPRALARGIRRGQGFMKFAAAYGIKPCTAKAKRSFPKRKKR